MNTYGIKYLGFLFYLDLIFILDHFDMNKTFSVDQWQKMKSTVIQYCVYIYICSDAVDVKCWSLSLQGLHHAVLSEQWHEFCGRICHLLCLGLHGI